MRDTEQQQQDIAALAMEHNDTVISNPQSNEKLLAGDTLVGYGRLAKINGLVEK